MFWKFCWMTLFVVRKESSLGTYWMSNTKLLQTEENMHHNIFKFKLWLNWFYQQFRNIWFYLFGKIWGSLLILYTAYLKASSVGESWHDHLCIYQLLDNLTMEWNITFWSSVKMAPILMTLVGRLRLGIKLKRPRAKGDQTIVVHFFLYLSLRDPTILWKPVFF